MAEETKRLSWPKTSNSIEKKRKRPKLSLIGALALCAAFVIFIVLSRIHYADYKVVFSDQNENVLAYHYYSFSKNILKVASDSAAYINDRNEVYWNVSYNMTEPKAAFCRSSAAVYDLNGTTILLCNTKGPVVTITTEMPIIRASVSENGSVAVITDDGTNAWIEYYERDGSKVSSIKTTMDATGYPYDAALSPNGTILAVSYISYEDSQMTSRLRFYDFSSGGRRTEDHVVSTFAYTGTLIPKLQYINDSTCAAFSDEGVYLFKGKEKPQQKKYIPAEGEIISTFGGDGYFGFVQIDQEEGKTKLMVYGASGWKKADEDVNISYTSVAVGGSDVILYNRNQIAIYSLNGIRKLECNSEDLIREMAPCGDNHYVMIVEEEYRLIALS